MRPFDYVRAGNAAEALERTVDGGELLAGGTDLLPLLDDGVLTPERLVDIKRLGDVDGAIDIDDGGVRIGALATLGDLLDHDGLAQQAPLLTEATAGAATPQIRSTATVAGNLLQRPRCWYFRNSHFRCWLAGGDACPAREGRNDLHAVFPSAEHNPCCAVHPSDLAPCLLALDAEALVRDGAGEERAVPVAELYREPTAERRAETLLGNELITAVRWQRPAPRSTYRKAMARQAWSFALAGVAVVADVQDGRVADVRIVLGGLSGIPRRARAAEAALQGEAPTVQRLDGAADEALQGAEPLAHNAYKVPLARGLVREALEAVLG